MLIIIIMHDKTDTQKEDCQDNDGGSCGVGGSSGGCGGASGSGGGGGGGSASCSNGDYRSDGGQLKTIDLGESRNSTNQTRGKHQRRTSGACLDKMNCSGSSASCASSSSTSSSQSSPGKIIRSDIKAVENLRRSFRAIESTLIGRRSSSSAAYTTSANTANTDYTSASSSSNTAAVKGIIKNLRRDTILAENRATKEVSCEATGDYRKNITDVVDMLVSA